MKVTIFSGITGFDKTQYVKGLTQLCLKRNGLPEDLESDKCKRFIYYSKFEDELLAENGSSTDISTFLEKPRFEEKSRIVEGAFQKIGERIRSLRPENVFLDIHLSYFKRSEFFPPLHPALLRQLDPYGDSPIKVVTLMDDVFNIWQNIRKRESLYPGTKLRLREILSWRSVEMLQAESVANIYATENRSVKNYLVPVRHPPDSVCNLILKERPVCAYLSFPITNTRGDPERVKDINQMRLKIHQIFLENEAVLFDPITVDELALETALGLCGDEPNVSLDAGMRWPIEKSPLVPEPQWPIHIPKDEVEEVIEDIRNHIRSRDFKLIDNSRFTLVYRPYFGGFSKGVDQEIGYTIFLGKRPYIHDPEQDHEPGARHPFDHSCVLLPTSNDFIEKATELCRS